MKPEDYQKLVQQRSPPRPLLKNMLWAFFVGGLICTVGQVASTLRKRLNGLKLRLLQ